MQGQRVSPAPQQATTTPQPTPTQVQPMQQFSPILSQVGTPAVTQQTTPVISSPIDPTQVSTALLYQRNKPLTPEQQALLSQIPTTQDNLVIPSHHAALNNTGAIASVRTAPMRPMDVAKEWFLDYVSPQSIKFYNKAIEHLPGEKFNGNMLHTWLQVLTDRAVNCAWTNILTIRGKLLTEHYADISLKEIKAHAQEYQNEGRRRAQNAEMLLQCIKASISKAVYSRVHHLKHNYTITREPDQVEVVDGVCYLKTVIDCYHVNTRSSTAEIRKKLAQLHIYMRHTAKGDVVHLCVYTRELLGKLRAAGEDTQDLLTNLLEALKQAPNHHFQRWLNTRIDLWSTKQIDWQPDGTDLMQEAEAYYLELKTKNMWSRRGNDGGLYVNQTTELETDMTDVENEGHVMDHVENSKQDTSAFGKDITALTLQLRKFNSKVDKKAAAQKYKWRYTPPKEGEPSTRNIRDNGQKKTYHWCSYHKQWTRHKPSECKKLAFSNKQQRKDKRNDYKDKKTAYMEAKAALQSLNLSSDTEEEEEVEIFNDSDTDSNTSESTEYYSDANDSNTS